ncbi:arsenate reductase/protein-tyrosine-phosphatase family protein [Marinibacterium profundimaris]|uniref:arsenate reductase/protein-tyrosine-phosphatase family protein n=1 Tax=Marinibacterium profundimaris TaxID=1679460 RepID=UPI001E3B1A69
MAHERRLDVFRLLMRRYPDAVPAGEIASALGLRANTTSVYLSILRRAGLISQTRSGTFQLYQIRMESVQDMFGRMLGDCCRNRPDLCLPGPTQRSLPLPDPTAERPLHVLFLCTHNSARSIIAEAMLRAAGPRFRAHSAGTDPAEAPHPAALDLLRQHGLDTSGLTSDPVEKMLDCGIEMDMVITVCDDAANGDDVHWPGAPLHAHWGVEDPLDTGSEAELRESMARAFAQIHRRITAFTALPIGTLPPAALQGQLDDIGRLRTPVTA